MTDIIKYEPNIAKAVTVCDISLITERELESLRKLSKKVSEQAERTLLSDITTCGITKWYAEILVRGIEDDDIKGVRREIVLSNATLPDAIEVADLLNKSGFTYEHIKIVLRFREVLKKHVVYKIPLSNEENAKFVAYKKIVDKIIKLFSEKYDMYDKTIILNRICEIYVNNPKYLETGNKPYVKQK